MKNSVRYPTFRIRLRHTSLGVFHHPKSLGVFARTNCTAAMLGAYTITGARRATHLMGVSLEHLSYVDDGHARKWKHTTQML